VLPQQKKAISLVELPAKYLIWIARRSAHQYRTVEQEKNAQRVVRKASSDKRKRAGYAGALFTLLFYANGFLSSSGLLSGSSACNLNAKTKIHMYNIRP